MFPKEKTRVMLALDKIKLFRLQVFLQMIEEISLVFVLTHKGFDVILRWSSLSENLLASERKHLRQSWLGQMLQYSLPVQWRIVKVVIKLIATES